MVVEFPVHEEHFTSRKEDVSVWKQVADVINIQSKWADNAASVTITFKEEEKQGAHPSLQDIKDAVKRGLHHMSERGYRVTAQKGTVVIREEKSREYHSRKKSSVPTVQQTVPYFFPGS